MKIYNIESVELHITDACTHRCPYCYADAKMTPETKYADFDTVKRIIDEISTSGAKVIALLGGDPVLHPRFIDIAKHVKKRGMKVACMSNTMHIKGYTPKEMLGIIDSIDTTIHGISAETHDEFCRCPGAYDSLMCQLKEYSRLGVVTNIVVNIIPHTFDKVYEIVEGVHSHGVLVNSLLTQRILPFGRAKNKNEYNLNAEHVNSAFAQIERAAIDFGIDVSVEDPYPLCCIDKRFWEYMHGCPEGTTRIAINMEGDVSRCGAVPDYSVGNVLRTPIQSIWKESIVFNSVRKGNHLTLPECKDCGFREQCCGGCPVHCEMCNYTGNSFIGSFREG